MAPELVLDNAVVNIEDGHFWLYSLNQSAQNVVSRNVDQVGNSVFRLSMSFVSFHWFDLGLEFIDHHGEVRDRMIEVATSVKYSN